MNLEIDIDELVLHGVSGDRHRIGEAVELHLAQLIAERGLPTRAAAAPDYQFQVKAGATPHAVGRQIARSIYSSLGDGR